MIGKFLISVFVLSFTICACGEGQSEPAGFDKADLRGKQDSSLEARICREHNLPRDCDVCAAAGWYGDGECDSFCRSEDEDCADTCEDVEEFVSEFCLPDDDDPLDWEDCLEGGGYMELGRECCQNQGDYVWCEGIGPDAGWCFGFDDGVGDCYVDFGDMEGCVPMPGDDYYAWAVICCEDVGFTFCNYMELPDPDIDFTFEDLQMPVPELVEIAGHIGLMQVTINRGDPFSQAGLQATLRGGHDYFGQACDAVPRYDAYFEENDSAESFISFMRYHTADWEMSLSAEEIDALEAYLVEEGTHNYRIFYGRLQTEACAGSGEVSYNLLWNVENNQVIYLILYPWTE